MIGEPEVIAVGEKGEVAIPLSIRKELGIKPKTKFLIYGDGNTVIMKKLELPDLEKEWEDIFKNMDKKKLKISEKEIQKEITKVRKIR